MPWIVDFIDRRTCEIARRKAPADPRFEASDTKEAVTHSGRGPHSIADHIMLPTPLVSATTLARARRCINATVFAKITHWQSPNWCADNFHHI